MTRYYWKSYKLEIMWSGKNVNSFKTLEAALEKFESLPEEDKRNTNIYKAIGKGEYYKREDFIRAGIKVGERK